ncbi:xylulokinase [Paenibacillus montanisoli]|uniref:xylulokinase n=1 Tax=Paenibacillus montanisoli TaxID=2081970 RepID=UPI001402D12E|nr:FGGY family carbohydrate kinase [Paenibacillus montanisoli]
MSKRARIILSLDIGSSSCKAVLFNEFGEELASGRGDYPLHHTGVPGEVEQHPEELWKGVRKAVSRLLRANINVSEISAISICSQMSSYFLVDKENRPLCNVISWMDHRALAEAEEMKSAYKPVDLFRLLGAELPVGPSWPIPKLHWLNRNSPSVVAKAKYCVQPKEWIIWKLTSNWRTDRSSSRGMVNQISGELVTELFEWAGIRQELLPPIGEPFEAAGSLQPAAAEALSLPAGIPVILGWNDLNAAVLGAVGTGGELRGFDITGTSEHIGIIRPGIRPEEQVIGSGINWVPFGHEHELFYGVTSSGGLALKWYVEQIDQFSPHQSARKSKRADGYHTVFGHAERINSGSDGVFFIPYLNGERSPWWNPAAKGVFYGLRFTHDRRHMARAVLEGVGYALRAIAQRLPEAPELIVSAGGSSRFPLWNQIKADILGIPISCLETSEAGCLGAAVLAAHASGWYGSLEEAGQQMIRTVDVYEPRAHHQRVYDDGYQVFNGLYQSLLPIFLA